MSQRAIFLHRADNLREFSFYRFFFLILAGRTNPSSANYQSRETGVG